MPEVLSRLAPANWLDYVMIGALVWGALAGLGAGLARSLAGLAALAGSWAAAALLTGPAVAWLNENYSAVTRAAAWLADRVELPEQLAGIPLTGDGLGDLAAQRGEFTLADDYWHLFLNYLNRSAALVEADAAAPPLADIMYHALALGMVGAGAFVALLVTTRWLIVLAGRAVSGAVRSRPTTALLDRLLGMVFGLIRNLAVLVLLFGLGSLLMGFSLPAGLQSAVAGSAYAPRLTQIFYLASPWLFQETGWISR